MKILPGIIFLLLVTISQKLSALTISVLEAAPSSVVYSNMLEAIYKRADIPLEFVVMPTQRSLSQSTRGIIDGELVRIHKVGDLYPTLIRVPTPYTFFESRAFARTKSIQRDIQQDGWNALQDYRIGIVRGMKHAEIGLKDNKDIIDVNRTEQLFRMLELNRLDIAISSGVNGLSFIDKFDLQSVHLLEPALQRHDLYHYLHEKNKHYIPILDKTIRAMKESGELEALKEFFISELLEGKLEVPGNSERN